MNESPNLSTPEPSTETADAYTLDLASTEPVPAGGNAQLYRQISDEATLVGFVAPADVSVVRVVAGARILARSDQQSWDEILLQGVMIPKGQYVTISVKNESGETKTIRVSLALRGRPPVTVGELPQGPSPVVLAPTAAPQAPVRRTVPDDVAIAVILQPKHAGHLLAYAGSGQRPLPEDTTFIVGRLDSALRSAETVEASKVVARPHETRIDLTAGLARAILTAFRRGGALGKEEARALRVAITGEPSKALDETPSEPKGSPYVPGLNVAIEALESVIKAGESAETALRMLRRMRELSADWSSVYPASLSPVPPNPGTPEASP